MMLNFSFTDKERESLTQLHAISTDTSESEILVGLTLEETAFYMDFTRKFLAGERNHHNLTRYLNLHDRHEAARLHLLGMAHYLRHTTPHPRSHQNHRRNLYYLDPMIPTGSY